MIVSLTPAKKKIEGASFKNFPRRSNTLPPPLYFGGDPGGTPYNGLYREAPPERGIFFGLQVYERVGILLVEVYKRIRKYVIWVCERVQRTNR